MPAKEIAPFISAIEQAYQRRSWHGTNLKGSVRGLSSRDIGFRPGRRRHSIHEIVVHCAYWKYAVARELLGEKRGLFPLKGSNWFPRTGHPGKKDWRRDIRLLDEMHAKLIRAAASLTARQLVRRTRSGKYSYADLLRGAAAHDLYHAGQIQLIKAIMRRS